MKTFTFADVVTSFRGGSSFTKKEYSSCGIPVIAKGDVRPFGQVNREIARFISEELKEKKSYPLTEEGDLIVTTRDLTTAANFLGLLSPVPPPYRFAVNQGANVLKIDQSKVNPRYLVYWTHFFEYRSHIKSHAVGSTQIHLRKDDFLSAPIELPDLKVQEAIAHILGTLDEKIELNQKMNQTLEEIAKAIFKSWFVDFDPVRAKAEGRSTGLPPEISALFPDELVDSEIGEIPKGWDIAPLDQIGNFRNGLAMQKYPAVDGEEKLPVVKIAQLRKGSTGGDDLFASGVPSDYVIADGDYVFSWSGSLMAKYWVGGKGALNQHLFKVEEKTQPLWFIAGWVENFMPEFQSIAKSKATTMGHIKREHLKQAVCAIPSQELIKCSAEVITPLIERSILSQQESKVLSKLRDTLLPKLISGELRIPDAEKFLKEAGI